MGEREWKRRESEVGEREGKIRQSEGGDSEGGEGRERDDVKMRRTLIDVKGAHRPTDGTYDHLK